MRMQKHNDTPREWINDCEARFKEKFSDIVEDICRRRGLRIIRLFGPTCSGKTTAAEILISLFAAEGKRAHIVSIDDFFYSREELLRLTREKGMSGIDYDSPDTIDGAALHDFAREIFEEERVHCPIFDFKEGRRTGYRELEIDSDDIFIFEGIQANYPNVIDMLSEHGSASIYIAPQSSLCVLGKEFLPNELRFMRRLVRDYHFRGSSPEFTFMLWESVRDNEEKNIFPYVQNHDYSVDSTMEYEIGVLKPYLCDIISKMSPDDPHYGRAEEILEKVKDIPAISREFILSGMLYCEFV